MKLPRFGGLIQNAAALVASGGVSAIVGVVFWVEATHLVPAKVVGEASAQIAAMAILGLLSQLSFGATFERFLPVAGEQSARFVVRAYVTSATAGVILSTAYIASGFGHAFIPSALGWRVLFVLSVTLWTIFALQDSVLVGLRSTRWVPVENITYSLAKLALLPLFITWSSRQGIFIAWNFPVIWLIVAVNWYLFKKRLPRHQRQSTSSEALPSTRQLLALSGAQYASLLVGVMSTSITTLIVIDRLGAVANAHYYIPAQIAAGVTLLIGGIMRSFYVEAASEPARVAEFARITLKTTVFLLLPILVVGVVFAPQILGVFGRGYSHDGATLLRMMLLSRPALAVTAFYSAFAWLDRRVWWFAIRELLGALIFFTVALTLLSRLGVIAIGIASLIESGVQGFFFLPILIRRYRLASAIIAEPANE